MAGKPIGEFSMKMITITNTPGPAGSLLIQVNFEGTATGFGSIFETATFIGGGKDGTFSIVGSAYMDNGEIVNGIGQGSYESKGKHKWTTTNTMELSDGRRIGGTGEIDLAARTWKGKITE
ncbi:MAG TPA: hypothetical protein VJX68_05530 [Candidatus Binatus sp.]|uniref:hypothetical protein n=1 Tax=Candidatus Binatus sp. TaxID=2811406 RepID=UPI002B494DC8|nr:hypothetical protein [Candidatus Binatus sp.]HKN12638.1 hypothetical protein [Candidatus Binatus sp.]